MNKTKRIRPKLKKALALTLAVFVAFAFLPNVTKAEAASSMLSGVAHVQTRGNVNGKVSADGTLTLGTRGQAKRVESVTVNFNNTTGYSGTIQYRVHRQTYNWTNWVNAGTPAGTTGQSKRLEAIEMRLTGELANYYDICYRVHIQTYGDNQGWVKNGALAGTTGESKRLEEVQVKLVKKSAQTTASVSYHVHRQTYGWEKTWATNGGVSGTTGQAKRLEGITISANTPYNGSITYRTHVQSHGWMNWVSDGEMSGTQGQAKRLEAIQIKLTGDMANHYDIYYRVHAQTYGWLAWTKNGESAGTAGLSKRLEAIQIVLVAKNASAPAASYGGITQTSNYAYVSTTGNKAGTSGSSTSGNSGSSSGGSNSGNSSGGSSSGGSASDNGSGGSSSGNTESSTKICEHDWVTVSDDANCAYYEIEENHVYQAEKTYHYVESTEYRCYVCDAYLEDLTDDELTKHFNSHGGYFYSSSAPKETWVCGYTKYNPSKKTYTVPAITGEYGVLKHVTYYRCNTCGKTVATEAEKTKSDVVNSSKSACNHKNTVTITVPEGKNLVEKSGNILDCGGTLTGYEKATGKTTSNWVSGNYFYGYEITSEEKVTYCADCGIQIGSITGGTVTQQHEHFYAIAPTSLSHVYKKPDSETDTYYVYCVGCGKLYKDASGNSQYISNTYDYGFNWTVKIPDGLKRNVDCRSSIPLSQGIDGLRYHADPHRGISGASPY